MRRPVFRKVNGTQNQKPHRRMEKQSLHTTGKFVTTEDYVSLYVCPEPSKKSPRTINFPTPSTLIQVKKKSSLKQGNSFHKICHII